MIGVVIVRGTDADDAGERLDECSVLLLEESLQDVGRLAHELARLARIVCNQSTE